GTWLTAMGLLCYAILHIVDNILIAIASVFLFNLLSLGIVLNYVGFNLKKMSFEKTRAYIAAKGKEVEPDESKTAGYDCNNNGKQRTMEPTESTQ
ncbi:hypothetical protein N9Q05_02070, partial [bacterium]|nr:hypothetical protein [bacterium]